MQCACYVSISAQLSLTHDGCVAPSGRQQVVHDEQENCVAQDEGHLEGGAVHTLRRQQEAEEVQCDEEAAGQYEVHHIEEWSTSQNDLRMRQKYKASRFFVRLNDIGLFPNK